MKQVFLVLASVAINIVATKNALASYEGFGKDSVDPKIIAKYAPTPLKPEVSRKIQAMLDLRSPGMGILSPDKKSLFFSWRVTGTNQVWKLNSPMGFPVQMTGGEDQTYLNEITPDGKFLILSRDRNGEEFPGLYLQPITGGELKKIIHESKVQVSFEFVSEDGKWIYFRANNIKPDSFAIHRYNIETAQSEKVFTEDGIWSVSDYKESKLLLSKAITNLASEIYEWDMASQKLTPILGQNEKVEYSVYYGNAKNEFIVMTSKFGEFRSLYQYKGEKFKPLTENLKWDVEGFGMDRKRKNIFYTVNENGYTKPFILDAKTFKQKKVPEFKNADHVYFGFIDKAGETVTVGVVTSQSPRISYTYNIKNQKLTQWLIPSTPEIDAKAFVSAKLETYTTRDNAKIPMFVRRPKSCEDKNLTKPCPVVVHFHGGPEAQSVSGFNLTAQMFVDSGIIFVEPNVRGSDGYGKSWLDSDNGPKRLSVITDIEDAAIYIKKNWAVNQQTPKVGIMGWSYGGYSSLVGMTKFSGQFDAGVALVGMSDLKTFLLNTAPYRRALRIPEYGDPVKDEAALKELSPVTYIDRLKSPLLIIQGVSDPRVPAGEAISFHEKALKRGVKSQLILFADEGHGASKRSNQVFELGHTLSFFQENLK
jgi:dipeptidyl aminopeptidase/acylaminoacyl peptidase